MPKDKENLELLERLEKLEKKLKKHKRKTNRRNKRKHHGRSRSHHRRSRDSSRDTSRSRESSRSSSRDVSSRCNSRDRSRSPVGGRLSLPDKPIELSESPAEEIQSSVSVDNSANLVSMSEHDILEIFGKRMYGDRQLAPGVIPDLAVRLEEIIEQGIPEDSLSVLLAKHTPPENCPRFEPPVLNKLIKVIMPENIVVRDDKILKRQIKISSSLSAIAGAIAILLNDKHFPQWKNLMESLTDASKLLADLQHDESIIRRNLMIANVDESMRDTLQSTKSDEFLFGKDLEETVKSTKSMQSTGKDLKKKEPLKPKNWKAPPRTQQKRFVQSGGSSKTKTAKKSQHQQRRQQRSGRDTKKTTHRR
ncbi:hypothetical protein DMENIID0001_101910 [Sergentomyia squamirostris]